MTLFDEVQELKKESHSKWFDRWYANMKFEKRIKIFASKGISFATIPIKEKNGEYENGRLLDPKTIEMLEEKLGEGFNIELKTDKFENQIFRTLVRTETYIKISW